MQNGRVEILLDRKRYLKFNFNAWCAVEEAAGVSLSEQANPLAIGIRGQRAMLYGGLIDDDPTLTVKQVGDFFDQFDKVMIVKKIGEAVVASNPQAKSGDASPNVPGLGDGTGMNSTAQPTASV